MKLDSKRSEGIDTGDWLATMRSAWKAGIDRDEREQSSASARRLARAVAPEKEKAQPQPLRDVLPLAACVGACALAFLALRPTTSGSGATNGIRADETSAAPATVMAPVMAPAEPAPAPAPAPALSSPAPVVAPAAAPSMRPAPAPAAPAKAKSDAEGLPPLPPLPPAPRSSAGGESSHHVVKTKRFELKFDRRWLRKDRAPAPTPPKRRDRDL